MLATGRALSAVSKKKKKKKKKKKLGFYDNNTINVSTHRLQIRSGTVEEDRFYTVSNLSELLTIDVYALIYSPGAA